MVGSGWWVRLPECYQSLRNVCGCSKPQPQAEEWGTGQGLSWLWVGTWGRPPQCRLGLRPGLGWGWPRKLLSEHQASLPPAPCWLSALLPGSIPASHLPTHFSVIKPKGVIQPLLYPHLSKHRVPDCTKHFSSRSYLILITCPSIYF